jgi:hypothetical protein
MKDWYIRNIDNITWWLIGWVSWGALDALARGNYGLATLDVAIIALNYFLWKNRN